MVKHGSRVVWTMGYDNLSKDAFLDLLKDHRIGVLMDVRSFPKSKLEHFCKEALEEWLPREAILYVWLGKELGGFRQGGYEEYMKIEFFSRGFEKLLEMTRGRMVCVMCLEPNPTYCHMRFIASHLGEAGLKWPI
ncbi:MAG: DUF488 domain-containing protein [Thermoproteota archaeon]